MTTLVTRVLVAIDDDALAPAVAAVGASLARQLRADLGFVHVVHVRHFLPREADATAVSIAVEAERDARRFVRQMTSGLHVSLALELVMVGRPVDVIVAAAREWPADLLVVGIGGASGLVDAVLGRVGQAVVHCAPCPVVVVRPTA